MNTHCTMARTGTSILLILSGCAANSHPAATDKAAGDSAAAGVAAPWRVACTGNGTPLASWQVVEDKWAPNAGQVLVLSATKHSSPSAFNLCIDEAQRFKDGTFTVHFRANSGMLDQGGGPIWRVQDADNYYLCRANPLEEDLRLYVVTGGVRKQLATVYAKHSTGMWHSLEVTHAGKKIVCVLDGHTQIEATDSTIMSEGAVGVWTKSDAKTSFVVPWALAMHP